MTDKILCVYHGPNCADGFTAAWVVFNALPNADFHAGVHGDVPPDVTGRHVLLVDFSYKRAVLEELASKAKSITVLDHHKTAIDDLAGYPTFRDAAEMLTALENVENPGIHAVFDLDRSGAGITWDFFHPGLPRPRIISYVEDRDLWRFKLPMSRDVAAYMFSHEYTIDNWNALSNAMRDDVGLRELAARGNAIEQKHMKDIKELIEVCKRRLLIGGNEVWAANLPYTYASDAANIMSEGQPFAATYFDKPGVRVFSLRSKEEGMDVSLIAKEYGGGGHKHAAGFTVSLGKIDQFEIEPVDAS